MNKDFDYSKNNSTGNIVNMVKFTAVKEPQFEKAVYHYLKRQIQFIPNSK